ncbi:LEA type 2 family protein [Halosegnis longus]|uniref:LEA type 2 family protein n=1 Tax=Halosegnis longus TaxID=2216012 RepID=UPI00096AB32C|nr:LEA type 2 family protein [Salella cibi]
MSLKTLLFGSKLKVAVTALVVVAGSVGGASALGVIGVPSVGTVDNSFGPVDDETTVINTDLVVVNPNPIGVRLGDSRIDYTVRMNDVPMASGNKSGLQIGSGNTTLAFSTRMDNSQIPPWWASHVRNNETTVVTIDANVSASLLGQRSTQLTQEREIQTDLIGQFNSDETRPVSGPDNPLIENPFLYVNATRAQWGTVTDAETPIAMEFDAYNPQTQPYTITSVGYNVTMNGIPVGDGVTERPYVIEGETTETIETTPTIDNSRLDDWWVSHLENEQVTDLRIDFYARVELPTGNTIRVPLDELTYERTIETDIFGTNGATNETTGDGGTPTPTPTDDEQTPADDGTATPTASPTGTDTPTATPTDDGGLL